MSVTPRATGPPTMLAQTGEFVCLMSLMLILSTTVLATPLQYTYDSPNLSFQPNGVPPFYLPKEEENDDEQYFDTG